jgi:hypothetical protein
VHGQRGRGVQPPEPADQLAQPLVGEPALVRSRSGSGTLRPAPYSSREAEVRIQVACAAPASTTPRGPPGRRGRAAARPSRRQPASTSSVTPISATQNGEMGRLRASTTADSPRRATSGRAGGPVPSARRGPAGPQRRGGRDLRAARVEAGGHEQHHRRDGDADGQPGQPGRPLAAAVTAAASSAADSAAETPRAACTARRSGQTRVGRPTSA